MAQKGAVFERSAIYNTVAQKHKAKLIKGVACDFLCVNTEGISLPLI